MEKVLPIVDPIVNSFAHVGMTFAMFQTKEDYYPWIINNYIQIYTLRNLPFFPERTGTLDYLYNEYGDWTMFHLSANPYLEYEKISFATLQFIGGSKSISEILINGINNDKYICIPVDMHELKIYGMYKTVHRVHHPFIVGYNIERGVFYACDTFRNGKFTCEEIKFEDLTNAYNMLLRLPIVASWSELGGICFYKFYQKPWQKANEQLYSVNCKMILNGMAQYLMLPGINSSYATVGYYRYGIDCYEELLHWLNVGAQSEESFVDHRAFSAMRDHKRIMVFRLDYIRDKLKLINVENCLESYRYIEKSMNLVVRKIIKGDMKKDIGQFKECIEILNEVKALEVEVLTKFIKNNLDQTSLQKYFIQ